jgi:anthranilate synthase component I
LYNPKNNLKYPPIMPLFYKKIRADLITPTAALARISAKHSDVMMLESVIGASRRGRYSIIAYMPKETFTFTSGDFAEFEAFMQRHFVEVPKELPKMASSIFGFMSYDMVRFMEHLPNKKPDSLNLPLGYYFAPYITIIFDNIFEVAYIVVNDKDDSKIAEAEALISSGDIDSNFTAQKLDWQTNINRSGYEEIVCKAKEYIVAGDIFQIVPSRRKWATYGGCDIDLYRSLRSLNPSPYMFFLKTASWTLLGSSPEIMVKKEGDKVVIRPIAGTRKRGATDIEDKALELELLADQKEISEHLMLLDLGRNDAARVAKPATVKVSEYMQVERYSHVMHIVSNVEGIIEDGKTAIDCLIAGFPAGTVSGAPKIRAMELIDMLEPCSRQFYAGTIGYFASNGDMDTAITLRSALLQDGVVYAQAGGGVVADSDPYSEFMETENKMNAVIKAAES